MQSLGFEAKNQTIYQMISDIDKVGRGIHVYDTLEIQFRIKDDWPNGVNVGGRSIGRGSGCSDILEVPDLAVPGFPTIRRCRADSETEKE